jgi:iron complex transport system ATP-binding protein
MFLAGTLRFAAEQTTAAALAETSTINPYFAVGTGPVDRGWHSVQRLYTDPELLNGVIERLQIRLGAAERRVATSTFYLGFAARLWSITLGAVLGHRLLPRLTVDDLLFRETDGRVELHIEHPLGWQGDGLEPALADMVLDWYLTPLADAVRRLDPLSPKLLRGNAASALIGAGRAYDRYRFPGSRSGSGWELAQRLCADQRLAGAVIFDETGYRRTTCCLYYRTPAGGLCGDCVLTQVPGTRGRKDP